MSFSHFISGMAGLLSPLFGGGITLAFSTFIEMNNGQLLLSTFILCIGFILLFNKVLVERL